MTSFTSSKKLLLLSVAAALAAIPAAVGAAALPHGTGAAYAPLNATNGLIAFQSYRFGSDDIFIMNPDGSSQVRITTDPSNDYGPVWSGDGSQIAFVSYRFAQPEIFTINRDGTGETRLTNNPAGDNDPDWSPDGTKIAFDTNRDGNYEIYVMSADGTNQTRITNNSLVDSSPSWSPDGTKIVFSRKPDPSLDNSDLYIMNADGTGAVPLVNTAAREFQPDWSPDGTKIVFGKEVALTNFDILTVNINGTGLFTITNTPGLYENIASWSPDGTKITYSASVSGNGEVYVVNADGTNAINVSNFPGTSNYSADWGPANVADIPTTTPTGSTTPTQTATESATATSTPSETATADPASTSTNTPTSVPAQPTATVTATVTDNCNLNFPDVPQGSTFYSYIHCLACQGVVSGFSDGTFRPGANITRGQIAKIVSGAAGFNDDPGQQIYSDVPPGSPFYTWINRLTNRGIVSGYPCPSRPGLAPCTPEDPGLFHPEAPATRGQLSKIVSNAAGYSEAVSGQSYADVIPSDPFYQYIERLTTRHVMSGYPCDADGYCDDQNRPYFRAWAQVTRGQAAKMVSNTFFPNCQASPLP